uniref:Uncharacterized protein n=1 Tax=Knipowitschia caucasica TaxID=637954 RepID=A0AAV2K321_KNICA
MAPPALICGSVLRLVHYDQTDGSAAARLSRQAPVECELVVLLRPQTWPARVKWVVKSWSMEAPGDYMLTWFHRFDMRCLDLLECA